MDLYNETGTLGGVAKAVGLTLPALKKIWYSEVKVKPWVLTEPRCPITRKQKIDPLYIDIHHEDLYKIGVVADTHLGSNFQQLDSLIAFYDLCKDKGVTTILHAGDLIDGTNKYENQRDKSFLHDPVPIFEYVRDRYPKIHGITTHYIIGNHTISESSKYEDYGDLLTKMRPDLICHGIKSATFSLPDETKIHLQHGAGKNRVYPSELVLLGHWHRFVDVQSGSSRMIQCPCFHDSICKPDYLPSDIGGLIVDINTNNIHIEYIKYDKLLYNY
jgi:predicted phosphodiesterase